MLSKVSIREINASMQYVDKLVELELAADGSVLRHILANLGHGVDGRLLGSVFWRIL